MAFSHKLLLQSSVLDVFGSPRYAEGNFSKFQNNSSFERRMKSRSCFKDFWLDFLKSKSVRHNGGDIVAIPITQICNLSIKLSHFRIKFNLVKLMPLYKKDSKTDPKNFKLISLLPIRISKIMEKIIHD